MKHFQEIDSYASTRNAALAKIKKAAGEGDILSEISEEENPKKQREREENCIATRIVIDKCLENYKDGEYSFPVTVRMICEALNKLK